MEIWYFRDMLKAQFNKHTLNFKQASGTSRGILTEKDCWIIEVYEQDRPHIKGIGECSIIKSLSPEWNDDYESKLSDVLLRINYYQDHLDELAEYPSIRFGVEMALLDLNNGGHQVYYGSKFTQGEEGIVINGLIWMGSREFMEHQIQEKLKAGFSCIKMKIGAIDFDTEIEILKGIRRHFSPVSVMLRVDANGAFSPEEALEKLRILSELELHSIEQPIKAGQWEKMAKLCVDTPLPIALDEELIGITDEVEMVNLLDTIQPQYIILKPSLIGGFEMSDKWIRLAEERQIGWWITSALESNIGLNAIAQYTFTKQNPLAQGLGTGGLFTNNFEGPLTIEGELLVHHPIFH